jgi:hypothetical protein
VGREHPVARTVGEIERLTFGVKGKAELALIRKAVALITVVNPAPLLRVVEVENPSYPNRAGDCFQVSCPHVGRLRVGIMLRLDVKWWWWRTTGDKKQEQ